MSDRLEMGPAHVCDDCAAELAELRAALAKEKERADTWEQVANGLQKQHASERSELAAERQAREKAEACWKQALDQHSAVLVGIWDLLAGKPPCEKSLMMNTVKDVQAIVVERDSLRAEAATLKERCATKHQDFGKLEMEWSQARAEVERLKAEVESVRLFANNTTVIENLTATLVEREAEIERLKGVAADYVDTHRLATSLAQSESEWAGLQVYRRRWSEAIKERNEARAKLATARAEALEEAAKLVEALCRPGVESEIARCIRALTDTKEGGEP